MWTPEDVQVMLQLHQLRWSVKRIAVELGVSKNTGPRLTPVIGDAQKGLG